MVASKIFPKLPYFGPTDTNKILYLNNFYIFYLKKKLKSKIVSKTNNCFFF